MDSSTEAIEAKAPPSDNSLEKESKMIATGGVIVVVATLIAQVLSMAATLWIARIVGPDKYGLISLATSLLLPLSALAALGLKNSLVRFVPVHIGNKDNARVAGVLSSAFLMAMISSLLITAAIVILSPLIANSIFSERRLEPVLRVLALAIPFTVLINLATAATRGKKVMHFDAIVQIAGPIVRLLAWVAGLLLLKNALDAAIYSSLLQRLFPAILALGFAYWMFREYFGNGIHWAFRSLWIYSAPLILSTLMYSLAPRMDRLVLGVVSDTRTVGVYSAAASLVVILTLVHASVVKTFLPVVADSYNRVSVSRAKELYITVTRWDARLTFTGVVASILVAQELLGLLGARYAEALVPFVILATAAYISTIPGPTGAFLQMTNHQRVDAVNAVVFFVLSPSIQLALALWLGWLGVAVGVLVVSILLNIVQVVEIRHFFSFHPFQQGHLLYSLLSLIVVSICAIAGVMLELPIRLILLGLVAGSFLGFIYFRRTPSDDLFLKMIIERTPFGKSAGTPE